MHVAALISWLTALSLSVLVSAQTPIATTTNATYTVPNDDSQSVRLLLQMTPGAPSYALAALTPDATNILQNNESSELQGSLVERDANNLGSNLAAGSLAFISCDASRYPGNIDLDGVVNNAVGANVSAIVFYSQNSPQCNLTGNAPNGLMTLYSTTAALDANNILNMLNPGVPSYILTVETLKQIGANGGDGTAPTLGGRSTAVAMIILYSITGIITALFLLIIVTGAVRAHRHPERYGPRNFGGRARQSRAKGIARAMLETIPIVKFGDPNPTKDVELSEAQSTNSPTQQQANDSSTAPTARSTEASDAAASNTAKPNTDVAASTDGPEAQAASSAAASGHNSTDGDDNNVACSICTEDFEKGQDIRLLPCNHKFHPACVDPWLLDVSGTCPLCRVDLRPAETCGNAGDSGDMPPPLDPTSAAATSSNSTGGRLRGLLRRVQPSTAEERIAALRRFREENSQTNAEAGASPQAEEGHASRWERVRRRVKF